MYIIRTSTNEKQKAKDLALILVQKKVAVSVHIREINSIYEWNNEIHDKIEWEVEAIVREYDDAYKVLKEYHDYELPEFIVTNVQSSKGIELWCYDWCNPLNKV